MSLKKQVFFLHFAGGNCYSFNYLLPLLSDFEVHQLELPGRGKRISQNYVNNKEEAILDYKKQLCDRLNGEDFLVFGHSMGAHLGLYILTLLEQQHVYPRCFIASGNAGPGCVENKGRYLMSEEDFIKELKNIGGMPDDFFDYPDLMEYFLPILKSDFKVLEAEPEIKLPPINTPIIAVMGSKEKENQSIDNWADYTTKKFKSLILEGNHFFINEQKETIVKLIREGLDSTLA